MTVLTDWINPRYLRPDVIHDIRESVYAKPSIKYAVLDDFFRVDMLDMIIVHHHTLRFDEVRDRTSGREWLPYDGAVKWADDHDIGAPLYFSLQWHDYLSDLCMVTPKKRGHTEVKLRYHKPHATGFWIHSDAGERSLVAICYFNKGWRAADGGLLQLWRIDETLAPGVPVFDGVRPDQRLDMLSLPRISTSSPGGGFSKPGRHDLVLLDQIIPTYNRLFVCGFQSDRAFHSVTPSNGRERYGMVQWLY